MHQVTPKSHFTVLLHWEINLPDNALNGYHRLAGRRHTPVMLAYSYCKDIVHFFPLCVMQITGEDERYHRKGTARHAEGDEKYGGWNGQGTTPSHARRNCRKELIERHHYSRRVIRAIHAQRSANHARWNRTGGAGNAQQCRWKPRRTLCRSSSTTTWTSACVRREFSLKPRNQAQDI